MARESGPRSRLEFVAHLCEDESVAPQPPQEHRLKRETNRREQHDVGSFVDEAAGQAMPHHRVAQRPPRSPDLASQEAEAVLSRRFDRRPQVDLSAERESVREVAESVAPGGMQRHVRPGSGEGVGEADMRSEASRLPRPVRQAQRGSWASLPGGDTAVLVDESCHLARKIEACPDDALPSRPHGCRLDG